MRIKLYVWNFSSPSMNSGKYFSLPYSSRMEAIYWYSIDILIYSQKKYRLIQ